MSTKGLNRLMLCVCFLLANLISVATTPALNKKMGKPTMEEMQLTVYDAEPNAPALTLMDKFELDYVLSSSNGFVLVYKVQHRVKILKEEGTSQGDISIPFFYDKQHPEFKDEIRNLKAVCYNLEDGKIVKTEVDKKLIFDEQEFGASWLKKFSIPNVKVGSVIEYSYELWSGLYYSIRPFAFQSEIPTLYAEHSVIIPEYFHFKVETSGMEQLYVTDEIIPMKLGGYGSEPVTCQGRKIFSQAYNLPSLKDDGKTYCLYDYTAKITFELAGIAFPRQEYQSFTVNSWDELDKSLLESKFADYMKMENPFKTETSAITFQEGDKIEDKVERIADFVNEKMTWNDRYSLIPASIEEDIKTGIGSNATLNFVLMSILRDFGVNSFPVAVCPRSAGVMSRSHIYPDSFKSFVVGFFDEDNNIHFIDCSTPFGGVDVLPAELNVASGRIISDTVLAEKWVSLDNLSRNVTRRMSTIKFENDSSQCKTTFVHTGNMAVVARQKYAEQTDSIAFVFTDLERERVDLKSAVFEGMTGRGDRTKYVYEYSTPVDFVGDEIYINPLHIIEINENPYVEETRKLPVEFPFTQEVNIMNTIQIPEGYEVESMPESVNIKTEDGSLQFLYTIKAENGLITLTYRTKIGTLLFSSEMYPQLKHIFDLMVQKNEEPIILKRISPQP